MAEDLDKGNVTGEGKERKELSKSEEELSLLLLALAEQCVGEGCLKAVFIFIKRTGNWGLWPCLPFVISPCLSGCREPQEAPSQREGELTNNGTHVSTNNSAAHFSHVPSVSCPMCVLSVIPHRHFLAASVGSAFSPISQIRKWSQRGEVICTRSHSF